MKMRTDIWTSEQDTYLAKIVLEYIRSGQTQLEAFDHIGEKFQRTGAAVGFRWNSVVRHQYKEEILLAKKDRLLFVKDRKNKAKSTVHSPVSEAPAPGFKKEVNLDIQENTKEEPHNTSVDSSNTNETKMNTKDIASKVETILAKMLKMKADLKESIFENERLKEALEHSNVEKDRLKSENERLKAELQSLNDEFLKLIEAFNELYYSSDEHDSNNQINSTMQSLKVANR